jgi:hypothetical protein
MMSVRMMHTLAVAAAVHMNKRLVSGIVTVQGYSRRTALHCMLHTRVLVAVFTASVAPNEPVCGVQSVKTAIVSFTIAG